MDPSIEGIFLDQSKCSKLSREEKRELVYELSKWPHGASKLLQSWSRQEILEILCAEMGKERKYTGLTKLKIIENLLKIVSEKKSLEHGTAVDLEMPSSPTSQRTAKRPRKMDNPSRVSIAACNLPVSISNAEFGNSVYCKNSACKAKLGRDDPFCRRCSCCICYQYDDNKDPSLWIVCSSDPPFNGISCGLSCHLECVLMHERSGISKVGRHEELDGNLYCVYCGKQNDLLGCCRKQLVLAKATRRVDILCYRLSLSKKLLGGTEKYSRVSELVNGALKMLEAEVGSPSGLPVKMGRGIVNRLSSGAEVQKLCALAVESLDSMLSSTISYNFHSPMIQGPGLIAGPCNMVRVQDVRATSLTVVLGPESPSTDDGIVGYHLWHRKAHEMDYPALPTCTLLVPNVRFVVSGLTPATEYIFKAVSFNGEMKDDKCEEAQFITCIAERSILEIVPSQARNVERVLSPATNCSSFSNPSSVEENNEIVPYTDLDNYLNHYKDADKTAQTEVPPLTSSEPIPPVAKPETKAQIEKTGINNRLTDPTKIGPEFGDSEAGLPITPCKLEKNPKDSLGRGRWPRQQKTGELENGSGKEGAGDGSPDKDFEFYVKVIRRLECEGHIEKKFRQKFLTWYGLRASVQEVRVVKVFVDTFIKDPASLAEQLVDSFSDSISSKRAAVVVRPGFCMKLWH